MVDVVQYKYARHSISAALVSSLIFRSWCWIHSSFVLTLHPPSSSLFLYLIIPSLSRPLRERGAWCQWTIRDPHRYILTWWARAMTPYTQPITFHTDALCAVGPGSCWTRVHNSKSPPPLKKGKKKKQTGKLNMRRTCIITNSLRYSIVYVALPFIFFFFFVWLLRKDGKFAFSRSSSWAMSRTISNSLRYMFLFCWFTAWPNGGMPPYTHQETKKKSTIPPAGAQHKVRDWHRSTP